MDGMRVLSERMLQAGLLACFAGLALFAQNSTDPVSAASAALRSRRFADALQILQPVLQKDPGNKQLWMLQGLAYLGQEKKTDALTSFRTALKISPDYLPALEGAAQIEFDSGSQAAVPLLEHVLRLKPDDATSHAMLAVIASRHGDCSTAIQHFDKSSALTNSQPAALQQEGICLVKLKQLERAITVFQKFLELNPEDMRARSQLAAAQLMAETPKDAISTLAPLLKTDAPDARVWRLASAAYEASGDTPGAVRLLREAIVKEPRNTDLYLDFAKLSMDHQSSDVGIEMINSGLKVEPDSAPLYLARGILFVQLARYDQAEADFDKANSLDPAGSMASVAQGLQAVQSNDPERALATVRAKLAKNPNDAYLLYLQADILAQKGTEPGSASFQEAIASAKKAVNLQPSLTAPRDVLAKLYLQAGQYELAIEQCRKTLEIDPKDQAAVYHLIQGLRKTQAKSEIPNLLRRLAELRAESSKQEGERNRYKLILENDSGASTQP
jgi:tetratricopeptide (TPR) repeat protein